MGKFMAFCVQENQLNSINIVIRKIQRSAFQEDMGI